MMPKNEAEGPFVRSAEHARAPACARSRRYRGAGVCAGAQVEH